MQKIIDQAQQNVKKAQEILAEMKKHQEEMSAMRQETIRSNNEQIKKWSK